MWTIEEQKRRRIWFAAIATLQLMSWVSATSRTFAPNDGAHQQGQIPHSVPAALDSKQGFKSMEGTVNNEEAYKMLSTLGSRPPNCDHKCGGCVPCEAIQVPTTTDRLGVQYANYEPEGWKCKCGTTFYNP